MRKINLIYLGALAQRQFNMKEDFKIIEFPADVGFSVRVAVPNSFSTFSHGLSSPTEFVEITFEKAGNPMEGEYIWFGYSARANVLVIRESRN